MSKEIKHIAINTRFLLKGGLEGMGRFTEEIVKRMVRDHPEVKFSFFFDRPFDPKFIYGPNVEAHVLFPPARHPFLFIAFFNWAVARKLRQLKPDLFFSPDGFLSLRTEVPQVPVFHDLAFMHYPEDVKKMEAWYYHKYFPRFAEKASRIITVSEYTKGDVSKQFGVSPEKMDVVFNAPLSNFSPSSLDYQKEIKAKFAQETDFFHFVGAIHPRKNLANLILAFDHFKQETGANTKLLIVGRKGWDFAKVIHSYEQSDYKEDILFTGYVSDEELRGIYSASLGLCYVPYFEGFGIPIVEAMSTDCPVICSNRTSMPEVAGPAALLVEPDNPAEIGAAMIRLKSEEGLRDSLIHRGRERKGLFDWEESARKTWASLQKALN